MKAKRIFKTITAAALAAAVFAGCSTSEVSSVPSSASRLDDEAAASAAGNDINVFRPADCGVQPQDVYSYPFIGLEFSLPENMLDKMDSREIFARTDEAYTADGKTDYAFMRFSSTTEEQRAVEGTAIDVFAWEAELERVGAIGVYSKESVSEIDALTDCSSHKKLGESDDGRYEYYLSTGTAEGDLIADFERTEALITEMREFDPSMGESAFSTGRTDGVANVGKFSGEDVFGEKYDESIFAEYDLTLVNCFATWCSPCVREMPELEALRKAYEEKGIKVGVAAVVLDTKYNGTIDEGAVERAQKLYELSGVGFPYLIPDDNGMNGRLVGIESVPETFFVDKNGNIVSEAYVGARSQEDWEKIVEEELTKLGGNS